MKRSAQWWRILHGIFTSLFVFKRSSASLTSSTKTVEQIQRIKSGGAWPKVAQWLYMHRVLPPQIRRIFFSLISCLSVGIILIAGSWYTTHQQTVPAIGGTYTEALVGTPQFINPLYASANDTDADLSRLIYSGIMAWDPVAGLVPSLASAYTISEDGKTYTFSLRTNALWHDGTPLTANDVLFTFSTIQNIATNSPLTPSFRGVTISQIDDHTVSFLLPAPFAPFLSTLTLGILPAHVWESVDPSALRLAEQNLTPIGSGPFRFSSYEKDKKGSILSYTLERFDQYFEQPAHVDTFVLRFYADADMAAKALLNKEVDGLAFANTVTVQEIQTSGDQSIYHPRLPQITALFFNLRKENMAQKNLRFALASALNKEQMLGNALPPGGRILHTPIPPESLKDPLENPAPFQREKAENLLKALGWKKNEAGKQVQGSGTNEKTLSITLATIHQPDFLSIAEQTANAWRDLGIEVNVQPLEVADTRTKIVQNHEFDVFLGSMLLGPTADPYPFWHSSQASDGGLNISGWANRQADALMVQARAQTNPDTRKETLTSFSKLVSEDLPAIFLAQPTYSYITSPRLNGIQLHQILTPSDRFGQVNQWYIHTKRSLSW